MAFETRLTQSFSVLISFSTYKLSDYASKQDFLSYYIWVAFKIANFVIFIELSFSYEVR